MRKAVGLKKALHHSVLAGSRLVLSATTGVVAAITIIAALILSPVDAYAIDASVTPTISNATVGYVAYHSESDMPTSITPVTGSFTISNFTSYYRQPGYAVFFVKPNDNYLLMGLGASGDGDLYSVEYAIQNNNYGRISGYPGISSLVSAAQQQGYTGFFGYSRQSNVTGNLAITFQVNAVQPQFSLSAVCDKASDVKPGDNLTFTLTATPATSINGQTLTTESLTLNAVTVNGQTISGVTLERQDDGTYKGTVNYTATAEDCASGSVELSATAAITYGYSLNITDSNGQHATIPSTSTITTTATTKCQIADNYGVTYEFTGDVPDGVSTPTDSNRYYAGQTVNVQDIDQKTIDHDGYTYTFEGWTLNGEAVSAGASVTVPEGGLVFKGNWKKTANVGYLRVSKKVTGGAANKAQSFNFKLKCKALAGNSYTMTDQNGKTETIQFDGDGSTDITLMHGDTKTISGLPAGSEIFVQETGLSKDAGTSTTVSLNGGESEVVKEKGDTTGDSTKQVSVNITKDDTATLDFTNNAELQPDTGLNTTNSTPMIALLGAAAAGGLALAVTTTRKRNGERKES